MMFKLFFLSCLIIVSPAFGEEMADIEKVFQEGETYYRKQNYQKAVDLYEDILSKGFKGASIHYNLGNAYFRLGDMGKTLLNYERALKFSPEDRELKHNLIFVRELLPDRIGAPESPRWIQRLKRSHHIFSMNAIMVVLSFCYSLILLAAAYAIFKVSFRPRFFRRILIPVGILFVIFLVLGGLKVLEPQLSPAIIIAKEVDVHYGPSAHETKAFVLHAGAKCSIRDISGEWVLIWLSNDRGGWVPQDTLERI